MWLFLCHMFALYQFILPTAYPTQLQFKHGETCTQTHTHSYFVRHMFLFHCCLTSTEARWPIRDGLSSHVCPLSVYTSLCPPHPAPVQTHMHTHTHLHMHTYMHIYMHAHTHAHTCTCTCTHTHMHVHTRTLSFTLFQACVQRTTFSVWKWNCTAVLPTSCLACPPSLLWMCRCGTCVHFHTNTWRPAGNKLISVQMKLCKKTKQGLYQCKKQVWNLDQALPHTSVGLSRP